MPVMRNVEITEKEIARESGGLEKNLTSQDAQHATISRSGKVRKP
jgi:hypothetical protein